jgi:tetratricopeptide (TPR) repeat protein
MVLISIFLLLSLNMNAQNLPDFDSLWNYNDPKQTEVVFREILKNTDEIAEPIYVAALQTQIARTLGLQQKFTEAHALMDSVQKKAIDDPTIRVRYLLEKGRLFNSENRLEEAIPLFQVAFQFSITYNLDYYAIDAAHMIAYTLIDFPEKKISWEEKALQMVLETTDVKAKKWEGSLYNNIGWSYFDLKNYPKAIQYFESSLAFENAKKNEESARIARWSIAKCYRMMGETDKALTLFKTLEAEITAQKLEPDGYVFEEIGECLLAKSQNNDAKPYFKKAFEILSKDIWLQKNESDRLNRLQSLSR